MICNYLDPECEKIRGLIDFNSKKWSKYIPGTGHYIYSSEEFHKLSLTENDLLIIANRNYKDEITRFIKEGFVYQIKVIEEMI